MSKGSRKTVEYHKDRLKDRTKSFYAKSSKSINTDRNKFTMAQVASNSNKPSRQTQLSNSKLNSKKLSIHTEHPPGLKFSDNKKLNTKTTFGSDDG